MLNLTDVCCSPEINRRKIIQLIFSRLINSVIVKHALFFNLFHYHFLIVISLSYNIKNLYMDWSYIEDQQSLIQFKGQGLQLLQLIFIWPPTRPDLTLGHFIMERTMYKLRLMHMLSQKNAWSCQHSPFWKHFRHQGMIQFIFSVIIVVRARLKSGWVSYRLQILALK